MATRKKQKKENGRPYGLKPEYIAQAKVLCANGATMRDLANHFGVSRQTIYNWKHQDREFLDALAIGWAWAAQEAEHSLVDLAKGVVTESEHTEEYETVDKEGNAVSKTSHKRSRIEHKPDIQAISKILDRHSKNFTVDGGRVSIDIEYSPEHLARNLLNNLLKEVP